MCVYEPGDSIELRSLSGSGHYVYELLDDAGKCRYVGRTTDPKGRFRSHINSRRDKPVGAWVSTAKNPRMRIIYAGLTLEMAHQLEAQLIAERPGMLNVTDYDRKPLAKTVIVKPR